MATRLSQTVRPYGVNRDLPPSLVAPEFWTASEGIDFDEARGKRSKGFIYQTPAPLFSPERILYAQPQSKRWYYSGKDGIGCNNGGVQHDLTPVGYPASPAIALHTWTLLNDVPVWNHPEFEPYYHDGVMANPMVKLPNWPATWTCQVMRAFKFYLMALNVGEGGTKYDNQVRWSASADVGNVPNDWTPSPTNDAGDMFFAATRGPILDGAPLGENFVVYKSASAYLMQYLGPPYVFGARKLFTTSGTLSKDCVAEWRGQHFVVTEGDMMVHDGANARSVVDNVVRREVFDDILDGGLSKCFVVHDPAELSMIFCYPSTDAGNWCDRMARWNYRDDRWSLEEAPDREVSHAGFGKYTLTGIGQSWDEQSPTTWDTMPGSWDRQQSSPVDAQPILALGDLKQFCQMLQGVQRNDEDVFSRLEWGSKDLGALAGGPPKERVLVDKLWINAEGAGNPDLAVRVGFQDAEDKPVSWGTAKTFKVGVDRYVSVLSAGRLVSVEISARTGQHWAVSALTFDFRAAGRY